jgi:hypothetical protein
MKEDTRAEETQTRMSFIISIFSSLAIEEAFVGQTNENSRKDKDSNLLWFE